MTNNDDLKSSQSDLVKPNSLFLYAHKTDLFCLTSTLDMT